MLYEYRRYDVIPGQLPNLVDHFSRNVMPLWEKHGVEVFGMWEPVIGVTSDFHYMLRHQNMADREQKIDAFLADPEWERIRAEPAYANQRVFRGTYQLWKPSRLSKLE